MVGSLYGMRRGDADRRADRFLELFGILEARDRLISGLSKGMKQKVLIGINAGWIFFSTPVDRARLAADTRYCVTLYFLAPLLALVAACLAWLFEAVWHALAHVVLLGLLGIFLMQASQCLWPRLPFSMRPGQRGQTPVLPAMSGV